MANFCFFQLKTHDGIDEFGLNHRVDEPEQRIRAAELALARAVAERKDVEAEVKELRLQLSGGSERVQKAEAKVTRLRRAAADSKDQLDELVGM
uniref:Myosin_tail_1 domain-containing protein n=1 Tax=Mesocestoides corti TaxID=53468 RepID=A0A5K3G6P1_MESCO